MDARDEFDEFMDNLTDEMAADVLTRLPPGGLESIRLSLVRYLEGYRAGDVHEAALLGLARFYDRLRHAAAEAAGEPYVPPIECLEAIGELRLIGPEKAADMLDALDTIAADHPGRERVREALARIVRGEGPVNA